ncbi:MAG: hypothetical protein F6K18_10930 [Okeania sp. SIO2C2]|uniref:hypothetical protein n=1 Tax=Okeania sp. SIO2C2 TaxID=2607787 RepID=UPI0013B66C6C|nr:hypothetical protein [Okeania sp. SIO2C2]NEP87298.1 hypothetical protein [Okeania sp. SIO2C2]
MNIKDFKSVLIVSVAIVLGVFVAPTKAANISRVVNFEDLTLGPEEFYNGSDGAGGFTSQDAFFYNSFNSTFGSWSGWSYSNTSFS